METRLANLVKFLETVSNLDYEFTIKTIETPLTIANEQEYVKLILKQFLEIIGCERAVFTLISPKREIVKLSDIIRIYNKEKRGDILRTGYQYLSEKFLLNIGCCGLEKDLEERILADTTFSSTIDLRRKNPMIESLKRGSFFQMYYDPKIINEFIQAGILKKDFIKETEKMFGKLSSKEKVAYRNDKRNYFVEFNFPLKYQGRIIAIISADRIREDIDPTKGLSKDTIKRGEYYLKIIGTRLIKEVIEGRTRALLEGSIPEEIIKLGRTNPEEYQKRMQGIKGDTGIIIIDIKGFTKLSEGVEVEKLSLILTNLNTELGNALKKYDAFWQKYTGDGMIIFFEDQNISERSIKCAQEIQKIFNNFNKSQDYIFEALRIGVHRGELVSKAVKRNSRGELIGFDYAGHPICIAKELEGCAYLHSPLISKAVVDSLSLKLRTELGIKENEKVRVPKTNKLINTYYLSK